MLQEIPYSKLKEKSLSYEIMLLYDQGNSFAALGRKFEISRDSAEQRFYTIKHKQIDYYMNHLSIVHGDQQYFQKLYKTVFDCYKTYPYIAVYLEKTYAEILADYRQGEPGIPRDVLKALPPLKETFSGRIISRIIFMREEEKRTYKEIGQFLKLTPEKSEGLYQHYYHQKFLDLVDRILVTTDAPSGFSAKYYRQSPKSHLRYALLAKDFPEFVSGDK